MIIISAVGCKGSWSRATKAAHRYLPDTVRWQQDRGDHQAVDMKFTEHLSAHITPEWRKQYIQYEVSFTVNIHSAAGEMLTS